MRNKALIFSVALLSLNAHSEESAWLKVSLSKEDVRGTNMLLALVRNASGFKKWLNGKALNERTLILTKKAAVPVQKNKSVALVKTKKQDFLQTTTITVATTKYVLIEEDEKNQPTRILIVDEIVKFTDVTQVAKGESPAHLAPVLISHKVEYSYPALAVETQNLDSKANAQYGKAINDLSQIEASDCVEGPAGSQICKVSDAAVKLVVAFSQQAPALAKKVAEIYEGGKYLLDSESRKSVTYELNSNGKDIRNVELVGFLRGAKEKLVTPDRSSLGSDSVSRFVVKFDEKKQPLIFERPQGEKPAVETLSFQ